MMCTRLTRDIISIATCVEFYPIPAIVHIPLAHQHMQSIVEYVVLGLQFLHNEDFNLLGDDFVETLRRFDLWLVERSRRWWVASVSSPR